MTGMKRARRVLHHLVATAAGAALVLVGCTADEPTDADGPTTPEPVVEEAAPEPEDPAPNPPDAPTDPALEADLERFCRAHDAALDAVDAFLAHDEGDDALVLLIGSMEAVTSTLAADLRADGRSLHPRVEPLAAAAEQTSADAREALDADHDARDDYVAEQLAGASYLQPLVDDPDLYATATGLAACADLPFGAVTSELRDTGDRPR